MNDLREGLANAIWPVSEWDDSYQCADAALAYIRQHDGHAEFVRAVRKVADTPYWHQGELLEKIVELCDAELAKEQP